MNWKKYLKIAAAILIIGAIVWAIYWFFTNNLTAKEIVGSLFPSSEKNTPDSQEIAAEKFKSLTNTPIFDYWINSKNGSIYYLNEEGQVIKINGDAAELINSQPAPKLNKVTASPDGVFAVAKFNYPTYPTFAIFNTNTDTWQPLPVNTIAAAWSLNSQNIAYVDDKSLKILNLTTKKTQEIIKLTQKDINLEWHSDSQILLSTDLGVAVKTLLLNINTKTLTPFLEETGLIIKWSDDNQLGIKFNNANGSPTTSLIDASGSVLSRLTFVTLPSKCLIQKNKIYCAVPKNIREKMDLPNDYYKKSVYFDDTLYLIDLANAGVSELKIESDIIIDADHLELFNNTLLFKNRIDEKLYSLQLTK